MTTEQLPFNPCIPRHYHVAPREARQLALELHLAGGPAAPKPSTWRLAGADLLHLLAITGIVISALAVAMVIWPVARWLAAIVAIAGLALGAFAATRIERRLPNQRDQLARRSASQYDLTVRLAEALQLPRERLSPAIVRELGMLRRNARARELSSPELRPYVEHYICRYRPGLTDLSLWRLPPRPAGKPTA